MNIHELATYNLDDAVKFHRRLNPVLWGRDEHLLPEVRDKLLRIAADFQEFLGVEDLKVKDITISGSNAAYSYTKQSDIDLHLVVEMPSDPVYQELFAAKKYQYNNEHDITIGGADVELYVQPEDQPHHSQGIYSIKNSDWVKVPQRKRSQIDDTCVLAKVDDLTNRIQSAVASKNKESMDTLWNKIKTMRQSGLENHGEFGCENVAFKLLRNNGSIGALKSAITAAQDRELSLPPKKRVRYGFSEDVTVTPDGVSASTNMFLNETPIDGVVQAFIKDAVQQLNIEHMPEVVLHNDASWSKQNNSFGQYNPGTRTLHVSLANRHLLDILRTVAHELTHCRQNELSELPDDAGETGSPWENEANAQAGILMRDFADANPEYFTESYTQAKSLQSSMKTFRALVRIKDRYGSPAIEAQVVARNHDMARQLLRAQYGPDSVVSTVTELKENASGYIPKNKKEAAMPQYAMALSVDIKPGQVGKEANKLSLKTGRNGEPGLLMPEAQNLLREFAEFTEEQDNLFEITMSPSSLRKLSAQTGALAGMEFEMIVPNIEGSGDGDMEPDYDYDQRCRSIEDAFDFFYDGDWNSRRDVERMRERMQNDYQEWLDDKIYQDWERRGEEYLEEWVPNNVDESEWNPEGLEGDERQEALEEYIANLHSDPGSSDAFDEYREENFESYDESDWLDDEDLDRMIGIENAYSMSWPHWTSVGSGETSIEDVADNFSDAIGRDVKASSQYHSSKVERPSTRSLHYIVEPDASLTPDDSNDRGLEFVSPPLPIEELLSDLNKVKAWADRTGCYTNATTGLHINVSVPGWTGGTDQLDYVKLALLLGDEFVLSSFGRAGYYYAQSAMGKIRSAVKQNPDRAKELMDRMKSGMDQLASKVIISRNAEKYTSINVKDGYIEFRSPGGDWLNDNFAEIDNTLRRFTVALSAAVNPEAYREEYLKKLYKLLDVSGEKDPLSYFAKFAAGELPKAALKSFVRQAQLERGVKRGKETGPMWWRVYKEGKGAANGAIIELVAATEEAAKRKAAQEWGEPLLVNVLAKMDAEPLRPYKEEPAQSPGASTTASHPEGRGRPHNPTGRYGIVARSDQAAYGRTGGPPPAYQFRFDMANLADQGHGRYVLQAWAARNSVDPADYIVVDTTQYADAAQMPTIDIDLEPAPAPQPAGMGQWNGQWKVLVGGQEVYRFGGVGNSQADANRIAAAWLRDNGQGVSGEGFEVYPVMNESLTESNQLQLKDFVVTISPHALSQAYNKGVDVDIVDDILRNISTVKDRIMSLEPGRALILHNGQGTGLGVRRQQGNRLTLATVFPTSPGFTKGKHPTFRVEANTVDEGVTSAMDAEQVLQYVKKTHGADKFNIEYSITDHPEWQLVKMPLSQLNLDPDGEQQDPYNRTNWVDYDVVNDLMPKIAQVLKSKPIVVDSNGWIIDGNHRAMAAVEAGLTSVPALVPVEVKEGVAEARKNPEQNTKYQSGWAELAAWAHKNNVWLKPHEWAISMTYVPKLGINPAPGISEDTPRGIYFYPFHWAYSVKMDKEALPWADNAPYIQLFQYSTGTELYDPNQIPLASAVAQLKNYGITDEDIAAEKENDPSISTYGLLVWCLGRKYDDNKRVSILNKVLRNLGYDYMIDNGKGWIAINEPTQGVVLNPKIIDKVVTFNNYTRQEEQDMTENFADGKNPGRKGLSKRVGVNTKASVSSLRKTAKNSSGEKQRMAHWLANMKAGRAKAKRK